MRLRVAARAPTREEAAIVGDEVEALYTNGPAGGGGTRKYVNEQIGIVSILLDRARVATAASPCANGVRMPKLYDLAHCRAGDKGNTSILSVIAYRPEDYALLAERVTVDAVRSICAASCRATSAATSCRSCPRCSSCASTR